MLKLLFVLTILSSCASSMKDRLKDGEIRIGSLIDLSRSSYLKGCTENSSHSFQECVKKSKEHQEVIKSILSN